MKYLTELAPPLVLPPPAHVQPPGGWAHGTAAFTPVTAPAGLIAAMPLGQSRKDAVGRHRADIRAVLDGTDDRLIVITGPCSVHDPAAALEYAAWLARMRDRYARELLIVMRVYFEKPRTTVGWKGLINDPGMDGTYDIGRGLRTARSLLLAITDAGLPAACEWLDPLTPLYLADAVAWGAIGARTTESQVHRQIASALPMPVGIKNSTSGDVQAAVDACLSATAGHTFLGATSAGASIVTSRGNRDCHVVLRGGRSGPNHARQHVQDTLTLLEAAGLPQRVIVDASHGNSDKDYRHQPRVAADLAAQVADGQKGIIGLMAESFLRAGRQEPGNPAELTYGQSVTDACMDQPMTGEILRVLAGAVRARRAADTW